MTHPVSVSERIRLLRQEIAELLLTDKIAPQRGPVAKSDRERDNGEAGRRAANKCSRVAES